MKLHRGPLKTHPDGGVTSGLSLHEVVRTDPATYYANETVLAEDKPSPEQEREAVVRCRDRLLDLIGRAGDEPQANTARAWMVRHPDKKGHWYVHLMVMGTKKWADVQEKVG